MSNVIPAEAGTQTRIVLMPAFAKRIHSDVSKSSSAALCG